MRYFPLFLDIQEKRVLLVGGGAVAQRKADLLLRAGCRLRVVAPHIGDEIKGLLAAGGGDWHERPYRCEDIDGCLLAVGATDDEALNRQVSDDCRRRAVPVNVVDCPALSDFIFPALVDRSPLVVAISTEGASPVLARRVRQKLESWLPMSTGALASFCRRFRAAVQQRLPFARRRLFWEEVIDGEVGETVLNGQTHKAEQLFHQQLARFAADEAEVGQVYIIGAGPGAADLLTFRASRLLQQADVVVYDRLVSKEILSLARRDAERIFVGKRREQKAASQEEINALLIRLARQGLRVARLKGGDPFIFGRGGEEADALRAAAVPLQIVPGITAASGCAAALEMPLTYRHIARSVRFVTVYERDRQDQQFWRRLAQECDTTQVFYMAGAVLEFVCGQLISAGRAAETPALLICGGTTPAQRHYAGTLATLTDIAGDWFSPALLVIGDVAALAASEPAGSGMESADINHWFTDINYAFSDSMANR